MRRTIVGSMNVGDALAQAQKVADALRAEGKVVTVGDEYDNVTTRYYGLRSVDIDISDPPQDETLMEAPEEQVIPEVPPVGDQSDEVAGSLVPASSDSDISVDASVEDSPATPDESTTEASTEPRGAAAIVGGLEAIYGDDMPPLPETDEDERQDPESAA